STLTQIATVCIIYNSQRRRTTSNINEIKKMKNLGTFGSPAGSSVPSSIGTRCLRGWKSQHYEWVCNILRRRSSSTAHLLRHHQGTSTPCNRPVSSTTLSETENLKSRDVGYAAHQHADATSISPEVDELHMLGNVALYRRFVKTVQERGGRRDREDVENCRDMGDVDNRPRAHSCIPEWNALCAEVRRRSQPNFMQDMNFLDF
ncbi:unnamed protein product, partial [Amoebophrya sp. A25]